MQSFLPDLKGDYKVLVYGNKAFALERKVADGDFRASGSGILIIDQKIPVSVLEYAFELTKRFGVPFAAYDIAYFEGNPELIEFQFVTFGTTTLYKSNRFYEYRDGVVREVHGRVPLEQAIADALMLYMKHI